MQHETYTGLSVDDVAGAAIKRYATTTGINPSYTTSYGTDSIFAINCTDNALREALETLLKDKGILGLEIIDNKIKFKYSDENFQAIINALDQAGAEAAGKTVPEYLGSFAVDQFRDVFSQNPDWTPQQQAQALRGLIEAATASLGFDETAQGRTLRAKLGGLIPKENGRY